MYFSTTAETQEVTGISETVAASLDDAIEIYDLRGNRVSREQMRRGAKNIKAALDGHSDHKI